MNPQQIITHINTLFDHRITFKERSGVWDQILPPDLSITLGKTIFLARGITINQLPISLIFHEVQHVVDQSRYNPRRDRFEYSLLKTAFFYFTYLLPFSLIPLLLPLLITPLWWLLPPLLIALLLFLPELSTRRRRYELRGYLWNHYIDGSTGFSPLFSGWTYFKMDRPRGDQHYITQMTLILKDPDPGVERLLRCYHSFNG